MRLSPGHHYIWDSAGCNPLPSGCDRDPSSFRDDYTVRGLAYVVSAPDIPADLYVAGPEGEDERRCTEINAAFLSERWLSTPQEVRYTRPDGTQIQGWVMHPPGFSPQAQYPLAVEIHGGPHAMWGNTFWHEFQVIAGRGYVVFFCNPRGSDGYGQAFRDASHARWGEADAGDILAGVTGLVKQGIIDEDRMAITGGSYGGYMTAWIIGHDKRFAAAVSQRGVYELVGFYGVTDIPLFIGSDAITHTYDPRTRRWHVVSIESQNAASCRRPASTAPRSWYLTARRSASSQVSAAPTDQTTRACSPGSTVTSYPRLPMPSPPPGSWVFDSLPRSTAIGLAVSRPRPMNAGRSQSYPHGVPLPLMNTGWVCSASYTK